MCKQVISHRLMAAKGDDSTNHSNTLQTVLDYIENNIRNELTAGMIAEKAGYSVYHFSRVFKQDIGISVMSYVTWRRLQHALYDLTQGKKFIDAAMEYGFETHAGFTKAFVHWFGFPPSLCRLRLTAKPPGYPTRHKLESMKGNVNASTFWEEANVNFSELTRLHNTFTKSKHFEICMCYDMDESAREFSYVVACGIDPRKTWSELNPI